MPSAADETSSKTQIPTVEDDGALTARVDAAVGTRYRIDRLVARSPDRLLFIGFDTLLNQPVVYH